MQTKSKIFRGAALADIRPGFRADVSSLASLPASSLKMLANIVIDDARTLIPTKISALARIIAKELRVPSDRAQALARAARSLSSQAATMEDTAADIADDLVSLEIIPQELGPKVGAFLEATQAQRSVFVDRSTRQEVVSGGGYHLTSSAVFAEMRAVFADSDYSKINVDTYVPRLVGLLPIVTLQLDLHKGDEGPKSISIRLSEDDVADLENLLKIARIEIDAVKKKSQGAER